MPILKYKMFENSEQFELFQKENKIAINQIQPIIKEMKQKNEDGSAKIEFEIFVVYFDRVELIKDELELEDKKNNIVNLLLLGNIRDWSKRCYGDFPEHVKEKERKSIKEILDKIL